MRRKCTESHLDPSRCRMRSWFSYVLAEYRIKTLADLCFWFLTGGCSARDTSWVTAVSPLCVVGQGHTWTHGHRHRKPGQVPSSHGMSLLLLALWHRQWPIKKRNCDACNQSWRDNEWGGTYKRATGTLILLYLVSVSIELDTSQNPNMGIKILLSSEIKSQLPNSISIRDLATVK